MGKYQKNIEAARRISVMQYLQAYHPGELVRKTDKEYGIEPSIEKTRNMQIQLEQQLASAEEEVKRPFPQATELTEKSKRLAVLEGLLNILNVAVRGEIAFALSATTPGRLTVCRLTGFTDIQIFLQVLLWSAAMAEKTLSV